MTFVEAASVLISEVPVDSFAFGMEFLHTHPSAEPRNDCMDLKCHQSLKPQSGETFDQQAVAERLLLQKIRAGSTYSSHGGLKVKRRETEGNT